LYRCQVDKTQRKAEAGQDKRGREGGREGGKEGRTYLIVIPQALVRLEHGLSGYFVIFRFEGLDATEGADVFGDDVTGAFVDQLGDIVLDGIQLRRREGGKEGKGNVFSRVEGANILSGHVPGSFVDELGDITFNRIEPKEGGREGGRAGMKKEIWEETGRKGGREGGREDIPSP